MRTGIVSCLLALSLAATQLAVLPAAAAAQGSSASRSMSVLMKPFDRLSRDLRRQFRCACRDFKLLSCPCRQRSVARSHGAAPPSPGSMDDRPADGPEPVHDAGSNRPEILTTDLTDADLAALQSAGYRVISERRSKLLQTSLHRLAGPPRLSLQRALTELRRLQPHRRFEANDRYTGISAEFDAAAEPCTGQCRPLIDTHWEDRFARCAAGARIGVVDTGVDVSHPAFRNSQIHLATTRSADRRPSGLRHGTGVVSLLSGERGTDLSPLAPEATLVAVDAFHAGPQGDVADVFDLVAALDTMADQRVSVVNMSLAGPHNPLLRDAIERLGQRGILTIAAVSANPRTRYPALYPGVIAVVPLDEKRQTYSAGAAAGAGILFAAPGADLTVAVPGGGQARARGASFAAPFVTAAFAMARQLVSDRDQAIRLITSGARELDAAYGSQERRLIRYSALPGC